MYNMCTAHVFIVSLSLLRTVCLAKYKYALNAASVLIAAGRWIPLRRLAHLLLAAVGGGVGTWLGVRLFHHKSSKRAFMIPLILATIVGALAWHTILDLLWEKAVDA